MNNTYVVIDSDLITNNMINESVGNETSYLKSVDGTKSILKFNISHPNTMPGHVKYNHTEILQFLIDNSIDWEGVIL